MITKSQLTHITCIYCGETKPIDLIARTAKCYQKYCKACDAVRAKTDRKEKQQRGYCPCGRKKDQTKKKCDRCSTYRVPLEQARINVMAYRERHKERLTIETKAKNRALKIKVLSGYCDELRCQCVGGCDEDHIEFLSLDHIYGGGHKHRKSIRDNFYRWIVNNNFPPGYQVLCMNCNFAKGRNGRVCPHERELVADLNSAFDPLVNVPDVLNVKSLVA